MCCTNIYTQNTSLGCLADCSLNSTDNRNLFAVLHVYMKICMQKENWPLTILKKVIGALKLNQLKNDSTPCESHILRSRATKS